MPESTKVITFIFQHYFYFHPNLHTFLQINHFLLCTLILSCRSIYRIQL